jgi:hypothetical protein
MIAVVVVAAILHIRAACNADRIRVDSEAQ